VLLFPMLAASLAFAASPDSQALGPFFASPIASSASSSDPHDRDALRAKRAAPTSIKSAKQSSRGRSLDTASLKALQGVDVDDGAFEVPAPPHRDNAYVCPSDMVMSGRSYCVDVYEA